VESPLTRQKRATPKYRWIVSLTVPNYDYLCVQAMHRGVTMARLLNEMLQDARRDIKTCSPTPERIQVN
jgi:hypothetical protein